MQNELTESHQQVTLIVWPGNKQRLAMDRISLLSAPYQMFEHNIYNLQKKIHPVLWNQNQFHSEPNLFALAELEPEPQCIPDLDQEP